MGVGKVLPVVEAFIAAALIPALIVGVLSTSWGAFLIALMITGTHSLLLGAPLFALLQWRRWVNAWTAVVGGAVVGLLPVAVFTWPLGFSELKTSAWTGGATGKSWWTAYLHRLGGSSTSMARFSSGASVPWLGWSSGRTYGYGEG
jgi:hypothetical protein